MRKNFEADVVSCTARFGSEGTCSKEGHCQEWILGLIARTRSAISDEKTRCASTICLTTPP